MGCDFTNCLADLALVLPSLSSVVLLSSLCQVGCSWWTQTCGAKYDPILLASWGVEVAQPGEDPSRLPELAADQLWLFALKLGRGKNERKKKRISTFIPPIPGSGELLGETTSSTKLQPWTGAIKAPIIPGCF